MITPKEAKEISYANRKRIIDERFAAILALSERSFKNTLESGKFSFVITYYLDKEYFNDIKALLCTYYKGYSNSCTYDNETGEMRFNMYW